MITLYYNFYKWPVGHIRLFNQMRFYDNVVIFSDARATINELQLIDLLTFLGEKLCSF